MPVRRAGIILMESVPTGVDMGDVKHDLEKVGARHFLHDLPNRGFWVSEFSTDND